MELIKFSQVYRDFRDGDEIIHALKPTDLMIHEGEFVAIIGPSGSGKSTLLTLMGGLQTPSGGTVYLKGKPFANLDEKHRGKIRFKEIGFILQGANLVPFLSVENQLRLVSDFAHEKFPKERAEQILSALNIYKLRRKYPSELSGGERQRVAIARALFTDPGLILADEPTAALDSKRAFEVASILKELTRKANKAVVMVTHDERLLQYVDRVYEINDGLLKEQLIDDKTSPAE